MKNDMFDFFASMGVFDKIAGGNKKKYKKKPIISKSNKIKPQRSNK